MVGVYVALYGIWSQQVFSDPASVTPWIDSVVTTAEGWQTSMVGWLDGDVTLGGLLSEPIRRTSVLGWGFLLINILVATAGFIASRNRTSMDRPDHDQASPLGV